VVSYWRQALIASDNRIPAMGGDRSVYTFGAVCAGDLVTVTAELRFRRLFQTVMGAKGWDTPDIVMEEAQVSLATRPCGDGPCCSYLGEGCRGRSSLLSVPVHRPISHLDWWGQEARGAIRM
jgi:hypothetical protein